MQRQKKAPPVTDGALVEAAGIEPASREESAVASTHVVDYLIVTLEAPADGLNFWLAKN